MATPYPVPVLRLGRPRWVDEFSAAWRAREPVLRMTLEYLQRLDVAPLRSRATEQAR